MLRCDSRGSVRSRRLAGGSDPAAALAAAVVVLKACPIGNWGSDTTRSLPLRGALESLPLLVDGRRHGAWGPVESKSLMEKDRRGAVASSKCAVRGGKGDEAELGAIWKVSVALAVAAGTCAMSSSSSLHAPSISTSAGFTSSLAEINVGVYLRSGYTRLMGFGMLVELRLFTLESSPSDTRGVK